MPLESIISRFNRVSYNDINEMYALHTRYFEHVVFSTFLSDMSEKDWVITLCDEQGVIVGFSTIQIIKMLVNNTEYAFLFSGDTVIAKEYWQRSTLAGSFSHFMVRMIDEMDGIDCFWFLISKGYRTYRFLPIFFNQFYPVYSKPTPLSYQRLIDHIGVQKYNGRYNAESGILEFAGQKDFLRPEFCAVEKRKLEDPHVRFFLRKNPHYYLGNELVCITDISYDNFNNRISKVLKQTRVWWNE